MTQHLAQPFKFDVGSIQLCGLAWGKAHSSFKVIALHGWQDNAASFSPLGQALTQLPQCGVQLLALDLPGHGHSDAFPLTQGYSLWDYAQSVVLWVQQRQEPVWFLGHSLGGMIAQIICAARPELAKGLITLDILSLSVDPTGQLSVDRMLEVLRALTSSDQSMRSSPDFADAIKRRARIGSPASHHANQILAERGFEHGASGWVPRLDPRVKAGGFMRLTSEGANALMALVSCPWHAILADQGITSAKRQQEAKLLQPALRIHPWSGGHHFHMEEKPTELFSLIKNILAGDA